MYVLPEVLSSCKQEENVEAGAKPLTAFEPSSWLSSLTVGQRDISMDRAALCGSDICGS